MAVLDEWQVQLGHTGILLGPGTDYVVESIDGLDRNIREADYDRSIADGSVMGPDYAEPKTVTITTRIEADTPADTMVLFDALDAAWNSTRLPEGVQSTADLRLRLPGRVAQTLIGGRPRRIGTDLSTLALGWLRIVATYYAPDPRIYSDEVHTQNVIPGSPGGLVDNAGNHPAPVWWDVYGPVTNPQLIRDESVHFQITDTIASGVFYRVRTDARTVTRSSDSANKYSTISGAPSPQPPWLEIPAGGAIFRATGSGLGTGATITATWRDTWL